GRRVRHRRGVHCDLAGPQLRHSSMVQRAAVRQYGGCAMNGLFPDDSDARKTYPVYSGLLAYFPAALAAIAHHSYVNNEKHNPGEPLHWNRAKSSDEADALLRHLMEGDYV